MAAASIPHAGSLYKRSRLLESCALCHAQVLTGVLLWNHLGMIHGKLGKSVNVWGEGTDTFRTGTANRAVPPFSSGISLSTAGA